MVLGLAGEPFYPGAKLADSIVSELFGAGKGKEGASGQVWGLVELFHVGGKVLVGGDGDVPVLVLCQLSLHLRNYMGQDAWDQELGRDVEGFEPQ